jgi:cell division protein FtsB
MLYDNIVQKLKEELNHIKIDNMKLKADIEMLKDEIRLLKNDKTFLESYNNRLLYTVKTTIVPDEMYRESRKWRQSS